MKSSANCREWLNSLPSTQGSLKKEQSIGENYSLRKECPLIKMKLGDYATSID